MDDGITLPGTDQLPDSQQAEDGIVNFLLTHPVPVAAVICAIIVVVLIKKYPVPMGMLGAGVLVYAFMKMSGKA